MTGVVPNKLRKKLRDEERFVFILVKNKCVIFLVKLCLVDIFITCNYIDFEVK